jgi:hypothetical protein
MKIATVLKSVLKIALLTILMTLLTAAGTALTGLSANASSRDAGTALLAVLVVSLLDTLLLCYFIVRSRLAGLTLVAVTALLYYGMKTFTSQLETAYFVNSIPRDMLPGLFGMTVPAALIWPPVAVWLFGKLRGKSEAAPEDSLSMPLSEWIWKALLVGAVIYPVLFFGFGYFVAWRNPDVRAYYGGVDNPNVIAYYINMFAHDPVVYPFEIMRGLLWFCMALPIVLTWKGRPWEAALAVALLFALIENGQHLIPNPLMPASVRLSHFIETSSSNFLLGLATVSVLYWHRARKTKTESTLAGQSSNVSI